MPDFYKIREVKRAARNRLFAIPGVHCVAIGAKKTAGQYTDEPSVQVFVTTKRPITELEPAEVIPAEIDGVKLDVIESPMPSLLAEDITGYDTLRGGIQIQAGGDSRGLGTLGFFVQSSDAQKIYAVTNYHVALMASAVSAGLDKTVNPEKHFATSVTLKFDGPFGSIDTHTIVAVELMALVSQPTPSIKDFGVVLSTPDGFHASDVATKIAQDINAIGGFNAIPSGSSLTITPIAPFTRVWVDCKTFGTKLTDHSDLRASVVNNVITFSGQASDPGGAFVHFNVGGALPSFGLFVPIAGGDDATKVATNATAALTALKAEQQLQNVTFTQAGTQLTIGGVDEIDCEIASDDRVGQPTNCFCARHHHCCSDRIGRIAAAALHVDAALIQLDGQRKYIAKVEDVDGNGGAIHAKHDITEEEAHAGFPVQKRGRTTGLTKGTARSVEADGIIGFQMESPHFGTTTSFFSRYYRNAIRIIPDEDHFSAGGDSGSPLMDFNNNLCGLVFAGGDDGHGLATPVADVLTAFKALNVVLSTTTEPTKALTVPGPAYSFTSLEPVNARSRIIAGTSLMFEKLHKAELEIESIPAGKELLDAVHRHVREGFQLVTTNRRVGAVWKRNGGQQIFAALLRLLQNPASRLPDKIGEKPLEECLNNIRRIFERYGSADFVAELKQRGDQLIRLMSVSYNEAKAALESAQSG